MAEARYVPQWGYGSIQLRLVKTSQTSLSMIRNVYASSYESNPVEAGITVT